MSLPPSSMVLPPYVECVYQIVVETMTPIPCHWSRQIAHHPYIDDDVNKCKDLMMRVKYFKAINS